jgi:hypothetical protein
VKGADTSSYTFNLTIAAWPLPLGPHSHAYQTPHLSLHFAMHVHVKLEHADMRTWQ